ncbi:MAG: DUF4231 domain-containing protein [Filimonas sp.]|nr:DUF4231 domain-containing protein [Filimonas sp.]
MSLNPSAPVTEKQVMALKNCITSKIDSFRHKGIKNKRGAIAAQVILISFSVITPILIGWKNSKGDLYPVLINLALISSGITAACSSLQVFFDWKDLWANYKVAKNGLETIMTELDYLISSDYENITQQDMRDFFNRYKDICAKMDESYKNVRTSDDNSRVAANGVSPQNP